MKDNSSTLQGRTYSMEVSSSYSAGSRPGIYKLKKASLDATMIFSIAELYQNITSCVSCKGLMSEDFQIKQGTRQLNRTSPILYLTFIKDLIKELMKSAYVFC
ncbi:hypothetical protein DPMN_053857 [Dreissena polymorpha]|uniref:Reverse transcriptase n=1 Tax=Dreissena polymorpha TaxID=45954 RepID=A0A9D4CPL9_DREPO|nr:hypothetical protein DPMN_053857 [Dreissena polymorpha]